jgi:hypothetical protein
MAAGATALTVSRTPTAARVRYLHSNAGQPQLCLRKGQLLRQDGSRSLDSIFSFSARERCLLVLLDTIHGSANLIPGSANLIPD